MDYERLYNELSSREVKKMGDRVKIRSGLFKENDKIAVFEDGGLYFSIDKNGIEELLSSIINRLNDIKSKDDFNKMIGLFNIIQSEMNRYFGIDDQLFREQFYVLNGKVDETEDKICSMSSIKGQGIAKCAEKASVANNILLLLNKMDLFPYEINYVNSLIEMQGEKSGHAYLEFSRINSAGNRVHIIYDVTNPEVVLSGGKKYSYPAVYSLSEEKFELFLQGGSFDNSCFIMNQIYPVTEKRVYSGFHIEKEYDEQQNEANSNVETINELQKIKDELMNDSEKSTQYNDTLDEVRDDYKKMWNESSDFDFVSSDDEYSDYMTLPTQSNGIHRR